MRARNALPRQAAADPDGGHGRFTRCLIATNARGLPALNRPFLWAARPRARLPTFFATP